MTISSYQIALLTVTLLLPGYVVDVALTARKARRRQATELEFFRWLVYSVACNAPWLVVGLIVLGEDLGSERAAWDYVVEHRWQVGLGWLAAMFVWPALVGVMFARIHNNPPPLLQPYVSRLYPESRASAWDAKFSEVDLRGGGWMIVLLQDGGWVAGEFVRGSYASIEENQRDIYLARVDYTSFDADFPGLEREGGIYIPADQIRGIRIWD